MQTKLSNQHKQITFRKLNCKKKVFYFIIIINIIQKGFKKELKKQFVNKTNVFPE